MPHRYRAVVSETYEAVTCFNKKSQEQEKGGRAEGR